MRTTEQTMAELDESERSVRATYDYQLRGLVISGEVILCLELIAALRALIAERDKD